MNKIVAITMVKNEEDIIESFIRYTLTYADVILVVNHNSDDSTGEILEKLQQEGLPIYVELFVDPRHLQAEVMTKLMYLALEQYDADIIIPLDADEFLLPFDKKMSVRKFLQTMSNKHVITLPWYIHRLKNINNVSDEFILNLPAIRTSNPNKMSKIMVGKVFLQRNKNMSLRQGNHSLQDDGNSSKVIDTIRSEYLYLAHFNIRSEEQYLSKIIVGALADIAKFSMDTCAGAATEWRNGLKKYIEKGFLDIPPVNDPADIMYENNFSIHLRYTKDRQYNLLNRVLKLSTRLAQDLSLEKIRNKHLQVGIICFLSSDYSFCENTVKSIVDQNYDYISCVLVDKAGECRDNYRKLKNTILKKHKKIKFEYASLLPYKNMGSFFDSISDCVNWRYVQLLKSGDLLMKNKILLSVAVLDNSELAEIVLCNVESNFDKYTNLMCSEKENELLLFTHFIDAIKKHKEPLCGLPSAFLFRGNILKSWRNISIPYLGNQPVFMEMINYAAPKEQTLISYIANAKVYCSPTDDNAYISHQIDRVKFFMSKIESEEKVNIVELNVLLNDIKHSCDTIDINDVKDKELIRIFKEIVNL